MKQLVYNSLVVLAVLACVSMHAQKQIKTFKEVFNVDKDAVLDLNTNNADIEFDTWNKDVIQIEATIEVEGMSKEEAEKYFTRNQMDILGNSKKVTVSTGGNSSKFYSKTNTFVNSRPIHFNSSNFPMRMSYNLDSIQFGVDNMERDTIVISSLLSDKDFKFVDFDYKEYEKNGKEYILKWQENFQKNMGVKNEEEIRKWVARIQEKSELIRKKAKIITEKHKAMAERIKSKAIKLDTIHFNTNTFYSNPNTFYISLDGEAKNLKVKKTIKIKMPKSATIKMDVRHGNVKLAENTTNINANLSYASLLATTINGDKTYVNASYSPVSVTNWNVGQLKTSYAKNVDLKQVKELTLSAVSSNIEIENLLKSAFIKNDFGNVRIKSISSNFEDLDITITSGELEAVLPKSSYSIYLKGKSSNLSLPTALSLTKTTNQNITVHKGYSISKNTSKSINIDASYSDVVLK
ncbi:hypothetical protein M4I21_08900 [Cellulophaga sp. 20_2_10]|uniref:hypothetical protein n=1 Tax=Cellulophaga sp. 20_2_10 TaxID=2942476 RepID=UPI00201AEFD0|nr:hypothetical protein [Cellulophaga sp. 20_2_10]MCL5245920.1 hypothetical protein [Cellulophaga sp. 20_2_10]